MLTIISTKYALRIMQPVPRSADRSFLVRVVERSASAEGGGHPLVGTAVASMPWLIEFEWQDTVAYARSTAAALVESAGEKAGRKSENSYALFSLIVY